MYQGRSQHHMLVSLAQAMVKHKLCGSLSPREFRKKTICHQSYMSRIIDIHNWPTMTRKALEETALVHQSFSERNAVLLIFEMES